MKLWKKLVEWIAFDAIEDAWMEGYRTCEADDEEGFADKDHFIGVQTGIIVEMMQVFDKAEVWDAVPADLRESLRSYV